MRAKLFVLLFILATVTFFMKDRYRGITDINPEVFREPIQGEIFSKDPIVFNKGGFAYRVTPLYDYDIAGLVVHGQGYNSWYNFSSDWMFSADLCLIWGDNVRSGVYKSSEAKFAQDSRFCLFSFSGAKPILNESISNNHLVIRNSELEKLAKAISAGDQVRIRGKLADIEVRPLTDPEKYASRDLIWNTSVTRNDSDVSETIYVESIEILKRGNIESHFLFTLSLYGLIAILLSGIWDLFRISIGDPRRPRSLKGD